MRFGPESTLAEGGAAGWTRRRVLKSLTALGISTPIFGRALATLAAEEGRITEEMISQAEWISGLEFNYRPVHRLQCRR